MKGTLSVLWRNLGRWQTRKYVRKGLRRGDWLCGNTFVWGPRININWMTRYPLRCAIPNNTMQYHTISKNTIHCRITGWQDCTVACSSVDSGNRAESWGGNRSERGRDCLRKLLAEKFYHQKGSTWWLGYRWSFLVRNLLIGYWYQHWDIEPPSTNNRQFL